MRACLQALVGAGLAALLVGCKSVQNWGDLNAPHGWRELDGPPVAVATERALPPIVTDDTPDDRWAAMLLARTIEDTSGRRPTVYVERPGQSCVPTNGLFIGGVCANRGWTCPLTNESAEAFRVVASNGCVRFLGRADFAVFDWCERELAMRYYPGRGMCVEPRREIYAQAVDYSDRPVFECRLLGGDPGQAWRRVARCGSVHRGGVSVHQPHRWVTNETLKAGLPCIFENGESPMLCYGNPSTLDYYKWRIDRHIAGVEDSGGIVDSRRKVITVSQWDAPIRCGCERCRDLYDPGLGANGEASPIIWGRFLRDLSAWLKAAHPDYEIAFLPYWNTCEVPRAWRPVPGVSWLMPSARRFEPLANAEAEVCTMPGMALLKNRPCKAREERIIRDWHAATGRKVLNWHYSCWPEERTAAPYVFGRTIQAHYADMADVTCGSFVCGNDSDPRLMLSLYVWMRCLWNPGIDVDTLYDEFARRTFGAAAKPMRRLIDLQEACWNRQWDDDDCSFRNIFEVSYPPEDVERMTALLREADELAVAAGDEAAVRCVRWYASAFEEFVAESETLAARTGRASIAPNETHEMIQARSALRPVPWARTTVVTAAEGGELRFTVRCFDPAAARMDFTRTVNDAVWGNDCVTFVLVEDGETRRVRVDLTGGIDGGWDGFAAQVAHDAAGWTVTARVRLGAGARAEGKVLGNVIRWRVGDRRSPEEERVEGSRYEWSRLNTCYTNPDTDPAAFVEFRLADGKGGR